MKALDMLHRTALGVVIAFVLAAFAGAQSPAPAAKPLRVVATLPDLADITREIGGERVEVTSICRGKENAHAVVAKPSHLVAMSKADLFVQIGLSLETTFVPGLLEACRNRAIQPGAAGFVNCSEGWAALDVPENLSRQSGDVHPHGNPHMNLDPRAGRHISARVCSALVAVDAAHKDGYQARLAAYVAKLDAAERRWAEASVSWKGAKFVEYHQEFRYFAAARGLELVGTLESKPGVPPTPVHLAELVAAMKKDDVKLILTAPWSNNDTVERVAEATGARVVELPNMCGGVPGTETWIGLMDQMHQRVGQVLGAGAPAK